MLGVGEVLPFSPTRRRAASLPVDVARTIEEALTNLRLDVVHVHEPFAPSASSVALRHSRALNVGSFHAPTERVLSTQLARPLSRLFFGRLDARTASYEATRELMQRFFPADYRVILPGADVDTDAAASDRDRTADAPAELVLIAREERASLRIFLRALRALPADLDWHATMWSPRPLTGSAALGRALRASVEFVDAEPARRGAGAGKAPTCWCSPPRACGRPRERSCGRSPPGWSRSPRACPCTRSCLPTASTATRSSQATSQTLASQLSRLIADPAPRRRDPAQLERLRSSFSWTRVADELEDVYTGLVARRHDGRGDSTLRGRLRERRLIDVDLHMHTDHSYDCATPVEVLLAEARARGLGAIAITDHNEVSGALRGP